MADETGSGEIDTGQLIDATLAAVHSYRSLYGNPVGSDAWTLVDALREFWLARFREGHPAPVWIIAARNKEAPAAGEDSATLARALEALENYGR